MEAAIVRLGYVPNRAARSLVTRRTGSVAVVMREPVDFGLADPHLASLVVAGPVAHRQRHPYGRPDGSSR